MDYVNLGRSGLQVSRLCFGCMSFGTPQWRGWVLSEEEAQPFFRRAIEAGINFFDTADQYSDGLSEEITGRALRKYGNLNEIVIATKLFFPIGGGPNCGGLSRKHIMQACEASLRRLGVDAIDLYQLHRFDPHTPIEETLSALDMLVQQGKVRYIGSSSCYAWEFMRALGKSDLNGWPRFISMQNHYNLVYREEEREMMPLCMQEGIGVIPWSPLARGLLGGGRKKLDDRESTKRAETDQFSAQLYDEASDWDVVKALDSVAQEKGIPHAQIALAWLMAKPGVTAPIIGTTKMAHLEDALKALEVKLSDDEVARLEAPYRPHSFKVSTPPAPVR